MNKVCARKQQDRRKIFARAKFFARFLLNQSLDEDK